MMDLVHSHYARFGVLTQRLLAALTDAGLTASVLRSGDLALLDQFHVRGRRASEDLAELLAPRPGACVLDVGSGIGGAARILADEYECRVIGLDLTEVYCQTAKVLGSETGLQWSLEFLCGNALSLPFADDSFDAVWSQHVAMNIADKATLYSEIARVLKPDGKLAINDIVAGTSDRLRFPLPWSPEPRWNHLLDAEALKQELENAGLTPITWQDKTEDAKTWDAAMRVTAGTDAQQIFGPDFQAMAANLGKAIEDGAVEVIQAVLTKS